MERTYNPDHHSDKMDEAMEMTRKETNKALFYLVKLYLYNSIYSTAARRCLEGRGFSQNKIFKTYLDAAFARGEVAKDEYLRQCSQMAE